MNPAKLKSQNHTEKPQNFLIKLDFKKKNRNGLGGKKNTNEDAKIHHRTFFRKEKKRKEKKIICGNTVAGGIGQGSGDRRKELEIERG